MDLIDSVERNGQSNQSDLKKKKKVMGHSNDTSKKKYNVVTLLKVKWRALAAQ